VIAIKEDIMARARVSQSRYVDSWKYLLSLKTSKILLVGAAGYVLYPYVKRLIQNTDMDGLARKVGDAIEHFGDTIEHFRD